MKTFVQYIEEKLLINKDFKGIVDFEMKKAFKKIFNINNVKDLNYDDGTSMWLFKIGEKDYEKVIDIIEERCNILNTNNLFVNKKDNNGEEGIYLKKQNDFLAICINNIDYKYPLVAIIYNDDYNVFLINNGLCAYTLTGYENNLKRVSNTKDEKISIKAYKLTYDVVNTIKTDLKLD